MTTQNRLRPKIRIIAFGDAMSAATRAWLRDALPAAFLQEEEQGTAPAILLYPGIRPTLAAGLAGGQDVPALIAQWQAMADQVRRRARTQDMPLATDRITCDAGATVAALADWSKTPAGPVAAAPDLPAPDLLTEYQLVTAQLADPVLADLMDRLGTPAPAPDALGALLAAAGREIAGLRAGAAAAHGQAEEAQGWIRTLRSRLWNEAERLRQSDSQVRSLQQQLHAAWKDTPSRAELAELTASKAELARARAQITTLTNARDRALAALGERDAYIRHVHGSRSWRVTEPLRSAGRLLRGGKRPA